MTVPSGGTVCLDCSLRPKGVVEPGVRHVRCVACRRQHRTAKAADAQWDRRQRGRNAQDRRRMALGWGPANDPLVRRARKRTPSWDRYGREVGTAHVSEVDLPALRAALAQLDVATTRVRMLLGH